MYSFFPPFFKVKSLFNKLLLLTKKRLVAPSVGKLDLDGEMSSQVFSVLWQQKCIFPCGWCPVSAEKAKKTNKRKVVTFSGCYRISPKGVVQNFKQLQARNLSTFFHSSNFNSRELQIQQVSTLFCISTLSCHFLTTYRAIQMRHTQKT